MLEFVFAEELPCRRRSELDLTDDDDDGSLCAPELDDVLEFRESRGVEGDEDASSSSSGSLRAKSGPSISSSALSSEKQDRKKLIIQHVKTSILRVG